MDHSKSAGLCYSLFEQIMSSVTATLHRLHGFNVIFYLLVRILHASVYYMAESFFSPLKIYCRPLLILYLDDIMCPQGALTHNPYF